MEGVSAGIRSRPNPVLMMLAGEGHPPHHQLIRRLLKCADKYPRQYGVPDLYDGLSDRSPEAFLLRLSLAGNRQPRGDQVSCLQPGHDSNPHGFSLLGLRIQVRKKPPTTETSPCPKEWKCQDFAGVGTSLHSWLSGLPRNSASRSCCVKYDLRTTPAQFLFLCGKSFHTGERNRADVLFLCCR